MNNQERALGGFTDKRGEWRPENPVSFAPVFVWPPKVKLFFKWLVNYLFTWNLLYLSLAIISYYWFQPPLETMKNFQVSWILILFLRNMSLVWIVYGSWHLFLYILKKKGNKGKYSPRWQSNDGSTFLWNNQVYDNVFWACASAVPIWTAYEVLTFWLYANDKLPYLSFREQPVIFVITFMLIPFWRELHFYLIHRLIHWKPLYDKIHYLHHYNINPGPWSGLAMHPVEHLLYFSVLLIHYIVPSHPLHFIFNSQHTALTPAPGHSGFEGKLGKYLSFGSYFHYLHHRLFECNYGESTIPLDKWFGIFEDGSKTQTEKQASALAFQKLQVTRIVEETPEVKSFYLKNLTEKEIKTPLAGQHLTIRFPLKGNKLMLENPEQEENIRYAFRNYTISNNFEDNEYRISVKKENNGLVSTTLHNDLKTGDIIEARAPKGAFILSAAKNKIKVFIAGGIGITPILPILKTISDSKEEMYLILSVKDKINVSFKKEIKQVCKQNPNLKVFFFLSREKNSTEDAFSQLGRTYLKRLDISILKEILPQKKHLECYVCGPLEMNQMLVAEIIKWKGKKSKVYTEDFKSSQKDSIQRSENRDILVHFKKSQKYFQWDNDYRNLLEFAESNGIRMEAGCMFGECGACSTNIIDGEVNYNYDTATKPAKGKCLPCSCFPKSNIILDA